MRLAFVSTMTAAPWGGSEELWSATARCALEAGWTVGVSTRHWPEPPSAIADLVRRGAMWWPRTTPIVSQRPRTWRDRILERARRSAPLSPFQPVFDFRPDVVCISQGGTFDFLLHDDLCELVRDAALPYVVLCRFNADDFFVHELLVPRAVAFLTSATHLGFAARRNLETAERQLAAALPRARVVQSPLRLPRFAALSWPSDAVPHFACVARLEAIYKGQDLLLESLSSPVWRAREWRVSFHGDGPDRARLEHLARFYNLSDRVRFTGHVPDIEAVWAASHLLVLPSRAEGTPQSLIQAMICGRPAVATDVGGVVDWLTEGRTGLVAEAPTAASLTRALDRAWEARARWPLMGAAAHEDALARVDPEPATTLVELLRATAPSI